MTKYLMMTVFMLASAISHVLRNSGYEAYPAIWKHFTIWHNLIQEQYSAPWPKRNLTKSKFPPSLFSQSACPSLHAVGDEMPIEDDGSTRIKSLHPVGSVGKVKFITKENPYTGLFQGAKYGIIRITLQEQPAPSINNPAFALAVKFLRDGVESASMLANFKPGGGQKSWNLFAENMSNHPTLFDEEDSDVLALKIKFATATPFIAKVGLSDLARYGENGKYFWDDEINYPYKLVFKPTGNLAFPDEYHGDLEDDLATIEVGSVLWEVYAWDNPPELNGKEEHIGSLILNSPLIRSIYGDTKLFFRHQDVREDFLLHPEWEEFTIASGAPLGVPTQCTGSRDASDESNGVPVGDLEMLTNLLFP